MGKPTTPVHASQSAAPLLAFVLCACLSVLPLETRGSAACRLNIEGNSRVGVSAAQFNCTGGKVTAAVDQPSLSLQGFKQTFTGITWSSDGCKRLPGKWGARCLVTICGDSSAVIERPTIVGVHVHDSGLDAVLCVYGNSSLVLDGAQFMHNRGTVLYMSDNSYVVVHAATVSSNEWNSAADCLPSTNSVVSTGGNSSLQVNASVFIANKGVCGGVLAAKNSSTVVLSATKVQGNVARFSGGALAAREKATLVLNSCHINNNTSTTGNGGALVARDFSTVTRQGYNTFTSNKAKEGVGGAVVLDHSAHMQDDNDSVTRFVANTALFAGALSSINSSSCVLNNAVWLNNTAVYGSGGAVTADTSSVKCDACVFDSNYAVHGGALYVQDRARASFIRGKPAASVVLVNVYTECILYIQWNLLVVHSKSTAHTVVDSFAVSCS